MKRADLVDLIRGRTDASKRRSVWKVDDLFVKICDDEGEAHKERRVANFLLRNGVSVPGRYRVVTLPERPDLWHVVMPTAPGVLVYDLPPEYRLRACRLALQELQRCCDLGMGTDDFASYNMTYDGDRVCLFDFELWYGPRVRITKDQRIEMESWLWRSFASGGQSKREDLFFTK